MRACRQLQAAAGRHRLHRGPAHPSTFPGDPQISRGEFARFALEWST